MTGVCHLVTNIKHILLFLTQKAGWNDVGYHNPSILTPNLDELALSGLRLEQNYAQEVCSPSRSALMTGMFPYHIGRQVSMLLVQ